MRDWKVALTIGKIIFGKVDAIFVSPSPQWYLSFIFLDKIKATIRFIRHIPVNEYFKIDIFILFDNIKVLFFKGKWLG
jgi:hypothetical protein